MSRWPAPPRLAAAFYKAHGLGNDYLVFEEGDDWLAAPRAVRAVCDPHRGVGSDGIVALLADRSEGVFWLRMFNPDGSEFERSGNGLRVLGSHLARGGERSPFTVEVGGSRVRMVHHGSSDGAHDISVDMGRARVGPAAVELNASALDAGNPHVVVLVDALMPSLLGRIGPFLVAHPALAHGANVQLARSAGAANENACEALIWERGVGPSSASGTSACAVAVALVSEGRLRPGDVTVRMPGGTMTVGVSEGLDVVLRGPVEEVCTGALTPDFLERIAR
jgi:diaminopimelate epimerase